MGRIRSRTTFLFGLLFLFADSSLAGAQSIDACESRPRPAPTQLQERVESRLQTLKSCAAAIDDRAACNRFVGRALSLLFDNSDFRQGDQFLLANDIANGLAQPGNLGW